MSDDSDFLACLARAALMNELADRERQLAEATREGEEQARLLGMSGEREARLLARVAELERQLAEARQVVLRGDVLLAEVERRWDAAEAKLRAVGELRSDVAGSAQILREMPDVTEQDQRVLAVLDVFVDKLDAIIHDYNPCGAEECDRNIATLNKARALFKEEHMPDQPICTARRLLDQLVEWIGDREDPTPDGFLREYFLLTGDHMILTEDGWMSGADKHTLDSEDEILDEVNAPVGDSRAALTDAPAPPRTD